MHGRHEVRNRRHGRSQKLSVVVGAECQCLRKSVPLLSGHVANTVTAERRTFTSLVYAPQPVHAGKSWAGDCGPVPPGRAGGVVSRSATESTPGTEPVKAIARNGRDRRRPRVRDVQRISKLKCRDRRNR